ncbi:MAG: sulfotransferase domain-containing protein [Planctomycetota bacterium JB042]
MLSRLEKSLPPRLRPLPEFLVLGTMKGGTTSLYRYLLAHPDVAAPSTKEIHFFDDHWREGVDWYRRRFPSVVPRVVRRLSGRRPIVTGEATTRYLSARKVPARVREVLPHARFVALLRDPATRAHSHYQHNRRHAREPRSFAAAIDAEIEGHARGELRVRPSYLGRGLYADQLERWWAEFPRDRFLIRRSEEFFADPARILDDVARFLGLAPFDWAASGATARAYNRHPYAPADAEALDRLRAWFRPHNERLAALFDPPREWWDRGGPPE